MKALRVVFQLGLLIGLGIEIPRLPTTAQSTSPKEARVPAPGLRMLTGDDVERARQLGGAIEVALKSDRWDEAIARSQELVALSIKAQGFAHHETIKNIWNLKSIERVARLSREDQAAFIQAKGWAKEAHDLFNRRAYDPATLLAEKALEVFTKLLGDEWPETAMGHGDLGACLYVRRKTGEARPHFERALAVHRRLYGEVHPEVAVAYLNLANNTALDGNKSAAEPIYEKAIQTADLYFGEGHSQTAEYCVLAAENLAGQGKYVEAQALQERALTIRRRQLGVSDSLTVATMHNLGMNLRTQGKFREARALLEECLAIHRRAGVAAETELVDTLNNLAVCFWSLGNFTEAQKHLEEALAIRRRSTSDVDLLSASCYMNLAMVLSEQGYIVAAQPICEKALEASLAIGSGDNQQVATALNTLALNLNAQCKYAEAQPLLERSLSIYRQRVGEAKPETLTALSNLGANLSDQGKFEEAGRIYASVLQTRRKQLSDDHPEVAASLANLAINLVKQGKLADAQALFEEALAIHRKRLSDDHPDTAQSSNNLAMILQLQGHYARAQPLFEIALNGRRRFLSDEHPLTLSSYKGLASNLWALGEYRQSCDVLTRAAHGLEIARLRIAVGGIDRATAMAGQDVLNPLAAILIRLGRPSDAWDRLEEDLGRGLLDELTARRDWRLAPAERARLRQMTTELERLDRLMEATTQDLEKGERAKQFEELRRKRGQASVALGEFRAKLDQDHGALAGQVAKLHEIQAALPADAALVAWVDIQAAGPNAADPDGEHWGVVLRSRGIPVWVPIAGTGKDGLWTKDDTGLVDRVRTELRKRPVAGSTGLYHLREKLRAQRLDPLVKALGPTSDDLPPTRSLIVLTSRAMAGIPVEALLTPDDTLTVSYAPSATVFKYLREQPRADRHAGLLALGDPVYKRSDTMNDPKPLPNHGLMIHVVSPGSNAAIHGLKPGDVLLAYNGVLLKKKDDLKVIAEGNKPIGVELWRDGQTSRRDLAPGKLGVVIDPRPAPETIAARWAINKMLVTTRAGTEDFDPLPGTRYEVEALDRLFKADDRPTRTLLAAEASEPELDRLTVADELDRFGYVHLATHGVIDEGAPVRSAVILTQTSLPDPLQQILDHKPVFDGRLSVREIQSGWNLKAELVTLSACETALGRDAGGEGFVGFTQALLMSGTRSVCLSLWKVDDTATALLMQRFYANLLGRRSGLTGPLPKAGALREAKAWLRGLTQAEALALAAELSGGVDRAKGAKGREPAEMNLTISADGLPYAHPYYWAAFVLIGDPD